MVCLGNICRSPLAEGILASKVTDDILVDSAGTSDWHVGKSPDPRSIEIAEKYNLDISHQKGRQFDVSDFDKFDLIYVMDATNYANIMRLARNKRDREKVDLILNEIEPGRNQQVPDPYFGEDDGFEIVFQLLDKATDKILEKIQKNIMNAPKVFLIPSLLGDGLPERVFPTYNIEVIRELQHFIVENEKSARRFIKTVVPEKPQSELQIQILNKRTSDEELEDLIQTLKDGNSVGVISEAGMPGIADPGAKLVWAAHQNNFQVIPLIGPSSIFLALAASGFNGQSFNFHGYLPIDKKERKQSLLKLESKSKSQGSAEIFMETPYRNNNFLNDILKTLSNATKLCVACDISLPSEQIHAASIQEWKSIKMDLHKRPAIFIIQT